MFKIISLLVISFAVISYASQFKQYFEPIDRLIESRTNYNNTIKDDDIVEENSCYRKHEKVWGKMLTVFYNFSLKRCSKNCINNDLCLAFQFDHDTGNCKTFYSYVEGTYSGVGSTSGEKSCFMKGCYMFKRGLTGQMLSSTKGESIEECINRCLFETNCEATEYNSQ